MTKLAPTAIMAVCYVTSFYFLAIALRTIPIGIAYAIWSGLGIVLISAIGYVKFRQALDTPGMIGVGLIVLGFIIANVFSKKRGALNRDRNSPWTPFGARPFWGKTFRIAASVALIVTTAQAGEALLPVGSRGHTRKWRNPAPRSRAAIWPCVN